MPHTKRMRHVSVWRVNVLPQMRKTFDSHEQQELTDSIGAKGILNAPIVALFEQTELEQYLRIINRLWKRTLSLNDLKACRERGKRYWLVLLAGERRIRSYKKHVRSGARPRMFQVVMHEHIDPFDALDIQITENSHRRPPPHEEAWTYAEYWTLLTEKQQEPTISQFAKRVGRSPDAIRSALRFVSLPEVVRNAVSGRWTTDESIKNKILTEKKRRLPYGIAVGLARLLEEGVLTNEASVELMLDVALCERKMNVERFQENVQKMIADKGQTLLGIMTADAEREARVRHRKKTVESHIIHLLEGERHYLARVIELARAGYLGAPEAIFASGSVRRHLFAVTELAEMAFQLLWKRPSPQVRKAVLSVKKLRAELTELESRTLQLFAK